MKRSLFVSFVGLLVAVPFLDASRVFAASASLSLSPASTSVAKGSIVSIGVYEDSGIDKVNAVKASLTYPANQLDFVSAETSSAFGVVAATSGGNGSVVIERGALPAATGKKLVATARFKAKIDSGTASIVFGSGSVVVSGGANILTGTSGSKLSFKPAVPAPVAMPKDNIPPAIKDVGATSIGIDTVTITWTTSEASTSEVSYGLDSRYGLLAADPALVTDHKVVLDSALLRPATEYYFAVKSVDSAGNIVSDTGKVFKTLGVTLLATIVDQHQEPLVGAQVKIGKASATTDKTGQAKLEGLKTGDFTGLVTHRGKRMVIEGEVKFATAGAASQAQTFSLDTSRSYMYLLWLLPAALLLCFPTILLFLKRGGGRSSKGIKNYLDASAAGFPTRPLWKKDNKVSDAKPDDRPSSLLADESSKTWTPPPDSR